MNETDVESCFADFTRRDWQVREEGGPLRFAVVGLGDFARERALPAVGESTFCETTVLVSGSPEKAARLGDEHAAEHVLSYEAFREGRMADAYDAVYVATPNAYHAEYVEAGAALGKHALCEKPLATSVDEAERMVAACRDAGVTLMTAYRLQTEPAVRRIRELVGAGVIGDPVHVSGRFAHPVDGAADAWRLDRGLAGGGAMVDLGIYPLNTGRFLLDADPVAARATTVPRTDGVDERAAFLLEFPGDATASGVASFDAYADSRLQFLGTEGRALVESPFGGVVSQEVVVERGDARTAYAGEPVDEVVEEFDYFAHCVLTGTRPEPDGEDGLADLRAIQAVYESADRGERVAI